MIHVGTRLRRLGCLSEATAPLARQRAGIPDWRSCRA